MERKIIVGILKRDIAKLYDIALFYAPDEKHDEIVMTRQSINAGLCDYELAWREHTRRLVGNEQMEGRE